MVNVSVPPTVTLPDILMPLARLMTRLLSVTAGKLVAAPVPLKVISEEDPPVRVPLVTDIAPSRVRVFAPIEKAPVVNASVPETVALEFKATPLELLIVKLLRAVTLEGIATELELPPKTKLELDVVDRLAAVPAIAGPFNVRV